MSAQRLRDRVSVRCSIADARERVKTYFATWSDSTGAARLQLRVDGVAVAVVRDARAERDRSEALPIRWGPEDGGSCPSFKGALALWADEDRKVTFVELEGAYVPPTGAVGVPFNPVRGHRFAWRIARTLLLDIAREIADRP